MATGTPIRAAAVAGLVVALARPLVPCAQWRRERAELTNRGTQPIVVAASDFDSRSVALGNGKSVVIDFPRDIKDVLVADPKIANAVVRSSRRAYIIGAEIGQPTCFSSMPTASRWRPRHCGQPRCQPDPCRYPTADPRL